MCVFFVVVVFFFALLYLYKLAPTQRPKYVLRIYHDQRCDYQRLATTVYKREMEEVDPR